LEASHDEHAAVIENEQSTDAAVAAAEAALEAIERECSELRDRPPVLPPDQRSGAGMILTLGRDGVPLLQPAFYAEPEAGAEDETDGASLEIVPDAGTGGEGRSAHSKRLVDELAMQRRDVLSLHLASDPALALDLLVFTLADADASDWR